MSELLLPSKVLLQSQREWLTDCKINRRPHVVKGERSAALWQGEWFGSYPLIAYTLVKSNGGFAPIDAAKPYYIGVADEAYAQDAVPEELVDMATQRVVGLGSAIGTLIDIVRNY